MALALTSAHAVTGSASSKELNIPKMGIKMPKMGIEPMQAATLPNASLADALFSGTQQRVLGLLFGQPDRSFYATELINMAGVGSGSGGGSGVGGGNSSVALTSTPAPESAGL